MLYVSASKELIEIQKENYSDTFMNDLLVGRTNMKTKLKNVGGHE